MKGRSTKFKVQNTRSPAISTFELRPSNFQRLWAPWRTTYLTTAIGGRQPCVFCAARRSRNDRKAHVLLRGRRAFVILNKYPYNNGHLMVAPARHVGGLDRLTRAEVDELMRLTTRMTKLLTQTLKPHGFNVGLNIGRVAGAGFPGHLHLHVVPRWSGDTNFMPVLGHTKVISQSLDALYEHLRARLR